MTNLGVAVEHLEEQTLIKPKVSLSYKKCTNKTNYMPRKMARRRLYRVQGEICARGDPDEILTGEHKRLQYKEMGPGMQSHKPWRVGETNF